MTISVVLADACILFSGTLRGYVICAADESAVEACWSRDSDLKRYTAREVLSLLVT